MRLDTERIQKAIDRAKRHIMAKGGVMTPEMLRDKPVRRAVRVTSSGFMAQIEPIIQEVSPRLRQSIEQDVQIFAGFKTYHHLRETTESAYHPNGDLKSWQEFQKDTRSIDDKYNRNWLRAEYAFVQSSAQMAEKWDRFAEFGDDYDLLYVTAKDERVREEHTQLEGMCLPFSDPAWNTCFPPNGWGCRCDVIQVIPGSHPRSSSEEMIRSMEQMTEGREEIFRFNPGKTGRLIPPRHPYYGRKGYDHCKTTKLAGKLEKNEECEILNNLVHSDKNRPKSKYTEEEQIARELYKQAQENKDLTKTIIFDEGSVIVEPNINEQERYKNIFTAGYLSRKYSSEILLYKDAGIISTPDSINRITNRKEEYKHLESNSYNSFDRELRKASKQADHIVFVVKGEFQKGDLIRALKSRFRRYSNLQTFRLIRDYEEDIELSREDILQENMEL